MNVNDIGEDRQGSKNSDVILKRNLAFAACQHAQVEPIYNRFNDANSDDALDAKQYDRGIESDKTSNRQDDASPSCRRGPAQCTYNGVCRLFSGLDERNDKECWDIGAASVNLPLPMRSTITRPTNAKMIPAHVTAI